MTVTAGKIFTIPSVENLRKASTAVYLACEKDVADDISNLLRWAANEIDHLAAKPDEEGVREAFKPFSDFMAGSTFDKLPDDAKLTNGSSLAWRQLTVGDFKKLRAAIWPSTTGAPKP